MKLENLKKHLLRMETLFLHPLPRLISTGEKMPSTQYKKMRDELKEFETSFKVKHITENINPGVK